MSEVNEDSEDNMAIASLIPDQEKLEFYKNSKSKKQEKSKEESMIPKL